MPYPLGAWAGDKFVFKTPEAERQWQADAFLQGSHHLLWMKGRRLRPDENTLAGMGLPPSDDTYLGPDGQHYQTTPASREDPHMAMLRAAHLAAEPAQGSASEMGQRASEKALPQAMAMMAQGGRVEARPPAANDNRAAANDNGIPPADKIYPGIGRFAAASNAAHQFTPPPHPPAAANGEVVHERSKAVATRSQVERFAPTNFAALAKEVEKYETDNPFFTRVGQRLKAGTLDMHAASAANVGAAALARSQLLTPYLDRIDQGENFGSVTTDPSDIAAHNSSDRNQPLPPQSQLTQDDIGLLSDYYAATPEERLAQRKQMVGASAEMLGDAAASRAASVAIARHPAVQAVARAIGEKRYRDAAEILKTYPLGIMGQVGVEGLPGALPGLAASLVNPALGAAVFAGSDAANAYGGALLNSLESQGVDTTDPLAIQKALSDPGIREAAEKYASKWAIGSAAVGLATGGVGGKIVSSAGKVVEEATNTVGAKLAKTGITRAGTETEFSAAELASKNVGRSAGATEESANPAAKADYALEIEPGNRPSEGPSQTSPIQRRKRWRRIYERNFYRENLDLEDKVVLHHARPQFILKRYPGVLTEEAMHALGNLRGIPKELATELHQKMIHKDWSRFLRENPTAAIERINEFAEEIDRKYGHLFLPPIGKKK